MAVTYKPSEAVDFVVVGSGAAGGVVAKELSTAGFSVVVLEQGPYLKERDFTHDEVAFNFHSPLTNDPETRRQSFRQTEDEVAKPVGRSVGYGCQVGGGSVHYAANYWRFHELDFHERSIWGDIPSTGFADWPITYADMEPYYTKAEWDIGVSGLGGSNPFDGPRSRPYPLPPMPVKSSGVLFERGAKKLGLHPFPAPMAIISKAYKGRAGCINCGFCARFGCEVGAKSSSLATVIRMAERTGKCEVRADAYVRKIQTGNSGRVTGAIYFDNNKKEIFQKAKAVVVCCNGAETPRLLLMSKSNRFPQGLANSSGLVGRYLMFDVGTTVEARFEHEMNDWKSAEVTRVVHDYYAADHKRGFYGGGGMDARFNYNPISYALRGVPRDEPQWGSEYKKNIAHNFSRTMTSMCHLTCLPLHQNSISLDPTLKDAWGLPAMRVTFKNHPDDMANMKFIAARQKEILEAAGAQKVWGGNIREIRGSVHLMGTCRMGNDPKTSVIDKYHRTHDVKNLFTVDGSSFVTSGRQQPTCTIQALAYRASDFIAKSAKAGEV